jgi:monothiol glutaredoxin
MNQNFTPSNNQDNSEPHDVQAWLKEVIESNSVILFMKGTPQFPMCGFSGKAVQILKSCGINKVTAVNVLEDAQVRQGIKDYAQWPTIPQLWINGEFIGGSDIMNEMFEAGELEPLIQQAINVA